MAGITPGELQGYPRESATLKQFSAQRKILVPWADRYTVRAQLLSHPGSKYPYLNDWSIRCTSVQIEPHGYTDDETTLHPEDGTGCLKYDYALLTAQYESPRQGDPQPHPDPSKFNDKTKVVTESFEPALEAMRINYKKFCWPDGTLLQPDEAPVESKYRMTYAIIRHYQQQFPNQAFEYIGKINSTPVSPVLITFHPTIDPATGLPPNPEINGFPARTLMMLVPQFVPSISDDGLLRWDITYRFMYKAEGWRKYWRGDKQEAQAIHKNNGTETNPVAGDEYTSPDEVDFNVFMP